MLHHIDDYRCLSTVFIFYNNKKHLSAFYLQPFPLLQQLLFPPQMKKIIIITMMIAQIHPEPKPSLFP